ncbi:MAG: hypothetical protein NTX72_03400 [Candidatus Uhrbacteria bacterium]|nr:hypothetical protein [Candidatus Uhrbacteria bacterium]
MSRLSKLLADLGMNIPIVDETTGTSSNTGTALAMPQKNAAAKRVIDEGVDMASIVYADLPPEVARSRMRERLVEVGEMVIFPIDFTAGVVEKEDGSPDLKIYATMNIPGVGHVEVQPLITLGVNYIGQTKEGKFRTLQTFQCLVFRPRFVDPKKPKENPYKAFPINFLSPSVLDTWNFIATQMPSLNWPTIDHIPNTLRKAGTRTLTFAPRCLKTLSFTNDKRVKRKGQWVNEPVTDSFRIVGYLFGQMLKLHALSDEPVTPALDADGKQRENKEGYQLVELDRREYVWSVKLGEGSLELSLIDLAENYKGDARVPIVEVRNEMDPFAVLGTTPLKMDINTVGDLTRAWVMRVYDETNPLYVYARDAGLVNIQDSQETMRPIIEDLGRTAVEKGIEDMKATYAEVTSRLSTASDKPSIEEVLNGRLLKAILFRMNKDDAAATWIDSKIEGSFDPKSPFHMAVRRYVIEMIATKANYKDPEPKKPEAPKPPVVEAAVLPPTTENAATPPA